MGASPAAISGSVIYTIPTASTCSTAASSALAKTTPAFEEGRKSLAAAFRFKATGRVIHVIANHWASKRGSTPTYRDPNLPRIVGGQSERAAQQAVIRAFIHDLIRREPDAWVLSVGDFNAPEYEPALVTHGSDPMFSLGELISDGDRYSYIFQGLAEAIDHQFARRSMRDCVEFEYVHLNAGFADKASDHDPAICRLR